MDVRHLPLQIAVRDGHTEVALSLIKHWTPMNQQDTHDHLPLHIAVKYGHTELALSLIKHGASVNQASSEGYLPLHHAVAQGLDGKHFNDDLFTKLMPGSSMDILKTICQILKQTKSTDKEKEHKMELLSSMLHKLIQHLILCEPLSINIKGDIYCFNISLNQHLIVKGTTLKTVYICSVLMILLGCDVSSVDSIVPQLPSLENSTAIPDYLQKAYSIDDLWNAYKQMAVIKTLQAVCIQKTRLSMNSLTDESFQSLPVPSCVRSLLKLHGVAHVLCEAYEMLPKFMTLEELM